MNAANPPHQTSLEQVSVQKYPRVPIFYWGILLGLAAGFTSIAGAVSFVVFWFLRLEARLHPIEVALFGIAGLLAVLSACLIIIDLGFLLPKYRIMSRLAEGDDFKVTGITVVLTAYNDEDSVGPAVQDFLTQPLVKRVIVISNNSKDRTMERAAEAGAIVYNEQKPGYGHCVYRCLTEGLAYDDSECVALCEGDMTFRGRDLTKFVAYMPHSQIVNGTRIVEQLRAYDTQLSTFMYYGNFFVGKLLEARHLGRGTFTDVGTTYKVIRRDALKRLLPVLNPNINLEFNAHFLDTALSYGFSLLECPVTFHPRVGLSKGGNVNNGRALQVGMRMIRGITFGWKP